MKTVKDFLNDGKLDYKAYADYLLTAFTALSKKQETLREIYEDAAYGDSDAKTATEVLLQNCQGMLNELQTQKDVGYPKEGEAQLWSSLHYFQQSAQDWKETLADSRGSDDYRLDNYKFELSGEGSVDFESFFKSDLFAEETIQTHSGIQRPEVKKITVTDKEFYSPYYSEFEAMEEGDIFPSEDGLPKPEDIHQTTSGTCYMLASLRSMARNNPHMLKSLFREVTDETATIRFYEQGKDPRTPVDITVSKTPIKGVDTKCATWVRLFEKAYAAYRSKVVGEKEKTMGKKGNLIDITKTFDYDAPSFFQALLPIRYREAPTNNEVEAQPSFEAGKEKFIELLKSAQGQPDTVMTLTTPHHVLELTKVGQKNGKTMVYYVDQYSGNNKPQENSISVDEIFRPDSQYDTIGIIQLNGNMPSKYMSFYPQSNARKLQALDRTLTEDSFVKDMTEQLTAEVTARSKAKGLYVDKVNPISQLVRNNKEIDNYLHDKFKNEIRMRNFTQRDFLKKCTPPEGPDSPIKGFADGMAHLLRKQLLDSNKPNLVSELDKIFNAPVNIPTAPKQEIPKQEVPKQEVPKQEVPKQEAPKQEVPKQKLSQQELVEKLKATAPGIDKQMAEWGELCAKNKKLQEFTDDAAGRLMTIQNAFENINAGIIGKLMNDKAFNQYVSHIASTAAVVEFVKRQGLTENSEINPEEARKAVENLTTFRAAHAKLMEDPEKLAAFLTAPGSKIGQLLQEQTVNDCLKEQFQKELVTEKAEEQPKQELAKQLEATEQSIDRQIAEWGEFGEAHKEMQAFISNRITTKLQVVKSGLEYIYSEDAENPGKQLMGKNVKIYASAAIVAEFLKRQGLTENSEIIPSAARRAVENLTTFNAAHAKLMDDPEKLMAFLINPNTMVEQMLQEKTVDDCLKEQFQGGLVTEKAEEQPDNAQTEQESSQEELAEKLNAAEQSIDRQIAEWEEFGKANQELRFFVNSSAVGALQRLKNDIPNIPDINAENNGPIKKNVTGFVSAAVVAKFLKRQGLADNSEVEPYLAMSALQNLQVFDTVCTNLVEDSTLLTTFLEDSDFVLEELLKDSTVNECLEEQFQKELMPEEVEEQPDEMQPKVEEVEEQPVDTQPKIEKVEEQPDDAQPEQGVPKQELVKQLKATAPSIDKQIAEWEKFGVANEKLQGITGFAVSNLGQVKGDFAYIHAGNIGNLKDDAINEHVESFTTAIIVAKFLKNQGLAETDFGNPYDARLAVKGLPAFKEAHEELLENPEKLMAFLTDPNPVLEQLLQEQTVDKFLDDRFRQSENLIQQQNIFNKFKEQYGDKQPETEKVEEAPDDAQPEAKEAEETLNNTQPEEAANDANAKAEERDIAEGNENYYKELVRLNNALKKTDSVFSNDTEQYKNLHSYLDVATAELGRLKKEESPQFSAKLSEHMKEISNKCREYKKTHWNLKSLSNRQMQRIKVMNRLECLQFRREEGVINPIKDINDVDYMLGDKMTQAHLMQKIQGKDGRKYIPVFCDAKRIDENARNMANLHPMEKAHGKRLPDDMKMRLLKTPCTTLYANGTKLLNMSKEDYGKVKDNVEKFLNVEPENPAAKKQTPIKTQQKAAPEQKKNNFVK